MKGIMLMSLFVARLREPPLPTSMPAIVASEMLLGGVGVGFFIWDQYNSSRISDIVVALIWVGLVGFALDRLVALCGHIVSRGASAS